MDGWPDRSKFDCRGAAEAPRPLTEELEASQIGLRCTRASRAAGGVAGLLARSRHDPELPMIRALDFAYLL
jgi:hypothetical protein